MDSEENLITTEVAETEVVKTEETESIESATIVVETEDNVEVQVTTQKTVIVEDNVELEVVNLEEKVNLENNENLEENVSATQKADLHIVINQQPVPEIAQKALIAEEFRKENTLIKAILVTIFCCLPFGIVAIIQVNKATSELERGNVTEAIAKNESAKKFIKYGLIVGLVCIIISIILRVAL